MKVALLLSLFALMFAASLKAQEDDKPAALNFTMRTIDGQDKTLADYQGKVLVVVNVASRCGLTPQYEKLQSLHEKYAEQGLAVLGFPCNQFGGQEPGSDEEISNFCTENYNVTFDMFSKINVNGDEACDFYKYLTGLDLQPKGAGSVSWNFEKFLVDRSGKVIARFSPRTDPQGNEFVAAVEKALADQ
jgi:glutathione peroxidase